MNDRECFFVADMAELADALDSGSSDLLNGRGGSTPLIRIFARRFN
jgi:hypothetical protein